MYDRVNKWGGAERVLLALHGMFPDAPLYTSVYDTRKASWAKVFPKIYTSYLQKIPPARGNHELLAPLMPLAFESFRFDNYDLVISVTSEAAKGIITKPQTKHVCYCLTPTRYLWSGYDDYFHGKFARTVSQKVVGYLREWDKVAAQRPDMMIAISTAVQERIKKYYGRDSEMVFPPVELLSPHRKKSLLRGPRKGAASRNFLDDAYFLVVSRFVSYKRVDLAIDTFNQLGLPLIIVGTGRQAAGLKLKAKSNIKFLGQVEEEKLAQIYAGAKALIMSQEEDFGLVAVEAQSFGVPVIAYKKGGVLDSVIEGKTGLFFGKQTPQSLIAAIAKFDKWHFNKEELITNAARFSKENFKKEFLKLIKEI